MTGVPPKLSTRTPPKGLASLSTIHAAITPWRDAFAEQTSLPRASRSRKDGQIRGRSRWFVRNAG